MHTEQDKRRVVELLIAELQSQIVKGAYWIAGGVRKEVDTGVESAAAELIQELRQRYLKQARDECYPICVVCKEAITGRVYYQGDQLHLPVHKGHRFEIKRSSNGGS